MANDNKTLELQIRIAAQEAFQAVTSLKGEIESLADEAKKFAGTDGAALNKSFKDAEAAAKDTVSGIGDIKKAIVNLAEVATLTKALSVIKDMGDFALQTADNFQTARNQFGVLLGDMEAGAGLFNEIKAFNDKTPFNLDTLTQTTNVLIAAKVPLKDLQAQLTKFGDLSQGNSQRLTSYVNAFSQAAAKGKADMQVLNTYLHQGVPILDELAKNFGVTTAEIVEMSSQGKINFTDFSKALDDLTAAGGQYFGGMELASQSLAAMQEGLKEAVNSLGASFGEMLLPAAIAVVSALTEITNAINESPILKGLIVGAIVALTGYLAAMAIKAGIAFAAQMALNLSIGALNPVVLASTIAVAGLAAGYTIYASKLQKAKRETEDLAYSQLKQKDATDEAAEAITRYTQALASLADENILRQIQYINSDIVETERSIRELTAQLDESTQRGDFNRAQRIQEIIASERQNLEVAKQSLLSAQGILSERRTDWIDSMFGNTQEAKIQRVNEQLAVANSYLNGAGTSDRNKLQAIIRDLNAELQRLTNNGEDINRKAAEWKENWAKIWGQFQADQAGDPFYSIELERRKTLEDAFNNYVRTANQETLDQVNAYYDAQRGEIIKKLADEEARARREMADEEARIQRELSASRIDDLQYDLQEALRAIDELEARRIAAAADSEEEIARIRETYEGMREDTELKFKIEIDKTELDEARQAVKDWQQELSDNITRALIDIEEFSSQAAVAIGDLSAQLIALSASSALSGFVELGRALGEGEDAAKSMERALAAMAEQILKQLPTMFLQAGLQLIANGQWALGLGFIAAAGSTAIISGYVDGKSQEASKNAHGNVFDEYEKAARAFADGGMFTNQIVSAPTYFRHGGGLGLMGEAGPEAIVPLTRMPNGDLGVQTANGGGAQVMVNIINNSGAEVRQEEREDGAGGKQIDVIIGEAVNRHIASGKADRAFGSRYNLRAAGV